jgi:hypothetical protein
MTPLERSVAAMRAVRVRWTHPLWAHPAMRRRVAEMLLAARRGEPLPQPGALIPAKPARRGVTHPSHAPRSCEKCGAEAQPYQRAPLITNVWRWFCTRCASTITYGKLGPTT